MRTGRRWRPTGRPADSVCRPTIRALRCSLAAKAAIEVLVGEARDASGLVVMRMPGPPTHVLSLACVEVSKVHLVELEGLARESASPTAESRDKL